MTESFDRNVLSETFCFFGWFWNRDWAGLGCGGWGWAGAGAGAGLGLGRLGLGSAHTFNENSKLMKMSFEAKFTQFLFILLLRV